MSAPAFPYATHLDVKFPPLALIDVAALARGVTDAWYNQTLCQVNDSVVRLGVMQGEYHWHKHDRDDEFFFVLEGSFIVDLEDRSIYWSSAKDETLTSFTTPQKVSARAVVGVPDFTVIGKTLFAVWTEDGQQVMVQRL